VQAGQAQRRPNRQRTCAVVGKNELHQDRTRVAALIKFEFPEIRKVLEDVRTQIYRRLDLAIFNSAVTSEIPAYIGGAIGLERLRRFRLASFDLAAGEIENGFHSTAPGERGHNSNCRITKTQTDTCFGRAPNPGIGKWIGPATIALY
jgi:hypothetical protein